MKPSNLEGKDVEANGSVSDCWLSLSGPTAKVRFLFRRRTRLCLHRRLLCHRQKRCPRSIPRCWIAKCRMTMRIGSRKKTIRTCGRSAGRSLPESNAKGSLPKHPMARHAGSNCSARKWSSQGT
jgi:hypothetical protein